MFPLNLQRNIVQLDKQISLLENECKNMEVDRKKKGLKREETYNTCSKISSGRLKPPTVKVTLKKNDSSKKNKKPTPSVLAKLQPSGSIQFDCNKTWSEIGDDLIEKKTRLCGFNSNNALCSCQTTGSLQSKSKKESKHSKCMCSNEGSMSEFSNGDCLNIQKDEVLHKELLFPNIGGAIEVTVTRKSNNGKENSPTQKISAKKSVTLENNVEKDFENCKCQIKGQKWSEILCSDISIQRDISYEKKKSFTDEMTTVAQPLQMFNNKKFGEYNSDRNALEETFELPVKLSSKTNNAKKEAEISSDKFEKEVQCSLENCCCGEPAKELQNSVKTFQFLINQIQELSAEELKKPSNCKKNLKDSFQQTSEEFKTISSSSITSDVIHSSTVKHHCENLIKEKTLLSQELLAKDNTIATMKKREEEYLSVIEDLKKNLEKAQKTAVEGMNALKEIKVVRSKFLEQMKVSEALKENHEKFQKVMEQFLLENEKLKTQIKILHLEAQKHEVLMAGKEIEIKRYREEIQNFQRQIAEHLSALKSNAQHVDIEKMIEAIVQQSQVFNQTDVESAVEKDEKDFSKTQNNLMHSSPTSTKTSVVNSSWKQISSIHDQSKANSDTVIYLNDQKNGKDFFQLFGENFSVEKLKWASPKTKTSVENSTDEKEKKQNSSFTSCLSVRDNHSGSESSNEDSLISKESLFTDEEKEEEIEEIKKRNRISLEKAQSNIEELLKSMKLKFSKEIFDTSIPTCTTEDFLDVSQISSIEP